MADAFEITDMDDPELQNQQAFDFEAQQETTFQELVVLNLISVDKSPFDIDQIFGFMTNSSVQLARGFFTHKDDNNKEIFRIANALNPGTFAEDTKTFAIIIATDLNNVSNPIETVKEMVNFAYDFSEKFHANICDAERMPITKQMISHIETKAQEIMRLKQLADFD